MAKNGNTPKPPEETAPAAIPPVVEDKPPAPPVPPVVPDPPKEKALVFRANWKLDGLPSGALVEGDTVELAEEVAAPLVECGVLSPVETEG